MENNEMMLNPQTGEVMEITPPVELTPEQIAALVAGSMNNEKTLFQSAALESGTADTPLKALNKLETKDVLNKDLHINVIHISHAAEKNSEMALGSDYPVMCFDEFPGYRYSGGKRLMQVIASWAKACGDDIDVIDKGEKQGFVFTGDRILPMLNEYISQGNHPRVILQKKKGANYVDVFVLGI